MGTRTSKSGMAVEGTSKSPFSEVNHTEIYFSEIPDDILAEIFLRLPGLDVVRSCLRVCKDWYNVGNTQTLWKDKCARDLKYSRDMLNILAGEDFKVLYFKNPYGKNLITNPDASSGMKGWTGIKNGGDGWRVEETPCGADPVEKFVDKRPDGRTIGCWSSSFYTCEKRQVIDLEKMGCSAKVLDELKPNICVSEWYAARFDCGIKYRLKVTLLGVKKDDLDNYDVEHEQPAGREWYQVNHTFSNYPNGVRYIEFKHRGKDTQFWAGCYGAKMTLATVKIDAQHCSGFLGKR